MSTHIIYSLKIVRFPANEKAGTTQDTFGLFILGGASNSYDGLGQSAKRSRDWGMIYCGEMPDLLAYAIDWSKIFNSGMTVWKNMGKSGQLKPQQWIEKIRRCALSAMTAAPDQLDSETIYIDGLAIRGNNDHHGMSIHQILSAVRKFGIEQPGTTMWQFVRVTGPTC